MSVHKELPYSLSWSIAQRQLTSKRWYTFMTAATVPPTLHMWF